MKRFISLLLGFVVVVSLLMGCGSDKENNKDEQNENQTAVELDGNSVNVKDLGAVGDGVTNDAEAFQNAIDSVTAKEEGGTVYFPEGTYLVEDWIILKSNLTIKMDENAVILNGINRSDGASIIFMCGPYSGSNKLVEWEGVENITFEGGTIDMNGELNASKTAPVNLPAVVSSTGGIALGYSENIVLRDVTFCDLFNGHALQICNSKNILIENCNFKGQSFPGSNTESDSSQKEYIQIEPSSAIGFPYATNDTFEASSNITIKNCYFGASDKCGEPISAVGTHSQKPTFEKCNNIIIEDCTFDNPAYAGVRFAGFEDVVIRNNEFIKRSVRESTNFRNSTCCLINIYCVSNTTDEMDLNKRIVIDNNKFTIDDPNTRAVRVGKDKSEIKGEVSDITITNNSFTNTSDVDSQPAFSLIRAKNAVVTGNTINGGWRGMYIDRCYGDVTIKNNVASNMTAENAYIRYTGKNESLSFYASDKGMIELETSGGKYHFSAVTLEDATFTGFYSDSAGNKLFSENSTLSYPINTVEQIAAYAKTK